MYAQPTEVYLSGVADNCQADHYARTVNVIGGDTTEVVFTIVCSQWGGVRVSATTSGVDQDFDGYRARLSRTGFDATVSVPANGSSSATRTRTGRLAVTLQGTSVNCVVSSAPTDSVVVPDGDTVNVPFTVTCGAASRLAFVRDDNNLRQIYAVNSNGGGLTRLSNRTGHDYSPAWSPDRTRIAFSGNRGDGSSHIFVMNADGSMPVQLTASVAGTAMYSASPRWSPDGSKIAFSSTRNGNPEIYVMS